MNEIISNSGNKSRETFNLEWNIENIENSKKKTKQSDVRFLKIHASSSRQAIGQHYTT